MQGCCPQGATQSRLSFHQFLVQHAPAYLEHFGATMPPRQREVLERILRCRTPFMGGELFHCPECGRSHYRYHSCNDRHCPLCGQNEAQEWLDAQKSRLLLDCPYTLITFTVPEGLRWLIRSHPAVGYDLLFAASARAMGDLAANPRHLGVQLGMLGVLQTWSRTLIYHPHIHYLVPSGGLSLDQRCWVTPRSPKYLLPFTPLADHFRTLFRRLAEQRAPEFFEQIPAKVWKQRWVVDVRGVGSGLKALEYLSRYIFQTATGNRSLTLLPEGRVTLSYRDSNTGTRESIQLEPFELIRRFLQHVLPKNYCRVRRFGWLHPSARIRANRVRALLGQTPLLTAPEQSQWLEECESFLDQTSVPVSPQTPPPPGPLCPQCRKPMRRIASWEKARPPPPLPESLAA